MNIRNRLARALAPKYFKMLENEAAAARMCAQEADFAANRRYAELVANMDPFEPLFQKLSIVFSEQYSRPEEKMADPNRLQFAMWAYQQRDDVYFNFLIDWIMNSNGNETLKAAAKSKEELADRMLYGRAQISSMILLRKEIGRLASLYEEKLSETRGEGFDTSISVE